RTVPAQAAGGRYGPADALRGWSPALLSPFDGDDPIRAGSGEFGSSHTVVACSHHWAGRLGACGTPGGAAPACRASDPEGRLGVHELEIAGEVHALLEGLLPVSLPDASFDRSTSTVVFG